MARLTPKPEVKLDEDLSDLIRQGLSDEEILEFVRRLLRAKRAVLWNEDPSRATKVR